LFPVKGLSDIRNLHMLWDAVLGKFDDLELPLNDDDFEFLTSEARRIRLAHPDSSIPDLFSKPRSKWSEESLQVSEDVVYSLEYDTEPSS
jgi:hypothetical protein